MHFVCLVGLASDYSIANNHYLYQGFTSRAARRPAGGFPERKVLV